MKLLNFGLCKSVILAIKVLEQHLYDIAAFIVSEKVLFDKFDKILLDWISVKVNIIALMEEDNWVSLMMLLYSNVKLSSFKELENAVRSVWFEKSVCNKQLFNTKLVIVKQGISVKSLVQPPEITSYSNFKLRLPKRLWDVVRGSPCVIWKNCPQQATV